MANEVSQFGSHDNAYTLVLFVWSWT